MAARELYLIAYDISDEKRLNRVRHFLKGYSTGGQKSVYECFLTERELNSIVEEITYLIDERYDRVHIFKVERRGKIHVLGIAVPPKDPSYFYIG
ncbi:MAG: CRISPR-associated endonuclease Cas2 [Candidatus Aminicenantes bacterium]|nr:CRISPR-associated endonuclease Cas2 [Candidatus Aminicenantes bacterium]